MTYSGNKTLKPESYTSAEAVTKSDATLLVGVKALLIGGAGTLNVRTAAGEIVLLSGLTAGSIIPLAVDQVRTGGTATLITALK